MNQEKSSICHDGGNYTKCFNKKFADHIDFGHDDGGVGFRSQDQNNILLKLRRSILLPKN